MFHVDVRVSSGCVPSQLGRHKVENIGLELMEEYWLYISSAHRSVRGRWQHW